MKNYKKLVWTSGIASIPTGTQTFTSSGTFIVPVGVTELCAAIVSGTGTSSFGSLFSAKSTTTTRSGASSITLSSMVSRMNLTGKGGTNIPARSTYATTTLSTYNPASPYSIEIPGSGGLYFVPNMAYGYLSVVQVMNASGTVLGNATTLSYTTTTITHSYAGIQFTVGGVYYPAVTGTASTANVNGTTYTFPANSAAVTYSIPIGTNKTYSWSLGAGSDPSITDTQGEVTGTMTGDIGGTDFSITPVAVGTPYKGAQATWKNTIPVTPGQSIPITVAANGVVKLLWGTGKSFPTNT